MIKTALTMLFCFTGFAAFSTANADTPLEIAMKHTAKAYHQLALDLKQPVDADKADYLSLATTMKTETQTARGLVPKKAAELPADQQAAMVTAYQKSIDDLSATIDTLIQAIQNSQWDDARKAIAAIKKQEDDGHKAFRKPESKEAPVTPPQIPPQAAPPTAPPQ